MHYHKVVMCISELHVNSNVAEVKVSFRPITAVAEMNGTPQQIVTEANSDLETLVRLYYRRHGFQRLDPMMTRFLPVFSF
jgi:hypothetical protein